MGVSKRFRTFLANICLTANQIAAGRERREAVVKVLNRNYRGQNNTTANSLFVGSWGKFTRVRPPRDVDVLYELPVDVYHRYEQRAGNKQSQLLQEIRSILTSEWPLTDIRGSGPVVIVPFSAYNVELIPAFKLKNGQYWVADTRNGGAYKVADYIAEGEKIAESNKITNGNARNLVRMMKCWQRECNVPLKSFWIELLSIEFLRDWQYADKSELYYDWMVRDFFAHLVSRSNGVLFAPGTFETIYLGNAWLSKAKSALYNAKEACNDEKDFPHIAGIMWQRIFGSDIPVAP